MSHLPMLLQLAVGQRRDVVVLKLLVLARALLVVFPRGEKPGLDPPLRHGIPPPLLRRLVDGLGDGGVELGFHFGPGHEVVDLLRFFAPLLLVFGREGGIGGAFIVVEVGEGEFEGLALGFLDGGGAFWVFLTVEGCGVEGLVGAAEWVSFPSH